MGIIVLIVIVVLVWTAISNRKDKEEQETKAETAKRKYLEDTFNQIKNEASSFTEYRCDDAGVRFAFDESKEIAYICNCIGAPMERVPFAKITGCTIKKDGNDLHPDPVPGAVLGGLIAGGAGAIVGAISSASSKQTMISSFDLVVYTSSLSTPSYTYHLISSPVSVKSEVVRKSAAFSEDVYAAVNAIVEKNKTAPDRIGENDMKLVLDNHDAAKLTDSMAVTKIICPHCESVIASGSKFCNQCGAKIRIDV